jgi:hypothetical protein
VSFKPQAASSLQFDTATPDKTAAAAASEGVTCVVCRRTITDKYFDVNAQTTCDRCRLQIARLAETPTEFSAFAKAALFGLGAAILGAVLYYAVIAITNFEIGLVAIAIGYMVGYAVRKGTEDRGGLRFQILAVVLTYWAVGLAYTPFLFTGNDQPQQEAQVAPASTEVVAADKTPEPEPAPAAEDGSANPAGLALALGMMFALTFALPVLSVVSSMPGGLISAAIILFGMQQAWRMTGAPHLVITGPFRIARPERPAASA